MKDKFQSKVISVRAIRVTKRANGEVSAEEIVLRLPPPPPPVGSKMLSRVRAAVARELGKVASEDPRLKGLALEEIRCLLNKSRCVLALPTGFSEGRSYALSIPAYYVSELFLDKVIKEFVVSKMVKEASEYGSFLVEVAYAPC